MDIESKVAQSSEQSIILASIWSIYEVACAAREYQKSDSSSYFMSSVFYPELSAIEANPAVKKLDELGGVNQKLSILKQLYVILKQRSFNPSAMFKIGIFDMSMCAGPGPFAKPA